jgi:hypothetical protein
MEFGLLYKKRKKTVEAIKHLQEAYFMYRNYFGLNSILTAEAATALVILKEKENHWKEAYNYAVISADSFGKVFGLSNFRRI